MCPGNEAVSAGRGLVELAGLSAPEGEMSRSHFCADQIFGVKKAPFPQSAAESSGKSPESGNGWGWKGALGSPRSR